MSKDDDSDDDRERRRQKRLRALGTNTPRCALCGEDDPRCLERHHIEGQAYGSTLAVVCRNCHRKLSDTQHDHPKADDAEDGACARARFLLGLADLLELAVAKLREVARDLFAPADGPSSPPEEDQDDAQ
jgi:hypothetical protein